MNRNQKQIIQNSLDSEKVVLDELKKVYEEALKTVNQNIAQLLAREDEENIQTIIYQLQYQAALKKQIDGILDDLNTKQFNSISEYLAKSYEDGFIGVMYDLQGQGIPLIFPIDQEQAVRAIQHDTKLSEDLYTRLRYDIDDLKKEIRQEISRGIASSLPYADVARNISNRSNMTLNKSMTIARTEGHRISQQATLDAQKEAIAHGADVVKQWDSALDGRTRPTHRELDGQIREVDEAFVIPSKPSRTAQYPSGFGIASEDVNCRCVLLQRAKWALDEDELETLKEKAHYHGLDKTQDFKNFKQKYMSASKKKI